MDTSRKKRAHIASFIGENKGLELHKRLPKKKDRNEYYLIKDSRGKILSKVGFNIEKEKVNLVNAETKPSERNRNFQQFLVAMTEQEAKAKQLNSMELETWDFKSMGKAYEKEFENQEKREKLAQKMGYRQEPETHPLTKRFVKTVRWADPTNFPKIKPKKQLK
jgi:ParB-like chromosome segregation protein Spo0J